MKVEAEDIIQEEIWNWIETIVEAPHTILNKYPFCPFAKNARLQNQVQVIVNTSSNLEAFILKTIANFVEPLEVQIIVEPNHPDPHHWSAQGIDRLCHRLNRRLSAQDLVLLADHPKDPGAIGPVVTSNGKYLLVLVQRASHLQRAHEQLTQTDYYSAWTRDYYRKIVERRQLYRSDPAPE